MQADAEDRKCADAFREYVVPVQMYSMLRDRSRSQPFALQRSLSYTAAHASLSRRCATSSGKAVWVSLSLPSKVNPHFPRKGPIPLQTRVCKSYSVFTVLCRKPSHEQAQAAFEPISVQHMRVPVQQRATGCSAPLRLPPAGLPGSAEAPDLSTAGLHIVFIISCNRCDLQVLLNGKTRHMQAAVSQERAFGFLEAGESVLWASVPVLQEALDAVTLRPGRLVLHPDGYRELSSSAAISFEPGLAASDQGEDIRGMPLDVALRFQDAQFPLPPSARFLEPEPLRLKHPVDKLVAARARNGLLPWGVVYFRFFTGQKKYATECTIHCKCPFCRTSMSTFTGLQQHMRASHDLFDYGFSEDSPMRLPAVSVEVAAGVYSSNHTFQSPEAANLRDSVSKEFFFYCPPGVRAERGKLGRRAGPGKRALPEAECLTPASKRARLTYLATTKDVNKAPLLPDDMELDDAAAPLLEGMLQRKAKQRAVVVPKVDLTRFYHARTCVQMTKTEVEAILADPQRAPDSDDEEDVEDWKDRCRRKLAPRTDITPADKAFMFNWNCHLRTNPIHADWQVPAACEAFTFNNRHNILRSMELRRIFTMHLTGLYEFGLLSPNDINKCLRLLEF